MLSNREKNPTTEAEKAEQSLAERIRKQRTNLTSETRAELDALRVDGTGAASVGFAKVKALIARMPSDAPEELMRKLDLMSQYRPMHAYMKDLV